VSSRCSVNTLTEQKRWLGHRMHKNCGI
jgi:hypothetical protein